MMSYILLVGLVLMTAVAAALVLVGILIYRNRKNARSTRANDLNQAEADEISSTWHILNP